MDLHLFKECVMLSPCPHCEQVVEIPTLRDHMLTECDKKDILKQCPRCK
jgi:centrosomal protein CEP104